MKKILLTPVGINGKIFTYFTDNIAYQDDYVRFFDVKDKCYRTVPSKRIVEIVEEDA